MTQEQRLTKLSWETAHPVLEEIDKRINEIGPSKAEELDLPGLASLVRFLAGMKKWSVLLRFEISKPWLFPARKELNAWLEKILFDPTSS